MNRAHKIRLRPTKEQEAQLWKSVHVARFAYNWALERWRIYHEAGLKANWAQIKRDFIKLRPVLFPWVSGVGAKTYYQEFQNVHTAYQNFFRELKRGKVCYPKFKSRFKDKPSFYLPNDTLRFYGKVVTLAGIGRVKMRELPRFSGKLLSGTVSCEAGQWYISLAYSLHDSEPLPFKNAIGIDLGLKSTVFCSDGFSFCLPNLSKQDRKVRRLQRKMSRQIKGSRNREKTKLKLQRAWKRIRDIRTDFLHKLSSAIADESQVVVVEDLSLKNMMKNRRLSNALGSACLSEFVRMLAYKVRHLVKVDRFFPSSQLCSKCGHRQKMPLHKRTYRCGSCGYTADRDHNAAINILKEGLNILGQALPESTPVDRKALARLTRRVKLCLEEAGTNRAYLHTF